MYMHDIVSTTNPFTPIVNVESSNFSIKLYHVIISNTCVNRMFLRFCNQLFLMQYHFMQLLYNYIYRQ